MLTFKTTRFILPVSGDMTRTKGGIMTPIKHTFLPVVLAISLTGCYTVLRESGEYYTEFRDNDYEVSDSVETENAQETVYEEPDQTVIIQRYYNSPWCPPYYPYSGWWVSVGYAPGYVHVVDPLWHWSYYYYGNYYWYGCWYPSIYTGPDYYYPRPHYPVYGGRRDYGLRTPVVNTSFDASAITTANRRVTAGSVRFKTTAAKSTSTESKKEASKSRDNAKRSYRPKSTQTRSNDKNTRVQTNREGNRSGGSREVKGNSGSKRSGESRSSGQRSGGRSGEKRKYN
jgi:hypothetical protein